MLAGSKKVINIKINGKNIKSFHTDTGNKKMKLTLNVYNQCKEILNGTEIQQEIKHLHLRIKNHNIQIISFNRQVISKYKKVAKVNI